MNSCTMLQASRKLPMARVSPQPSGETKSTDDRIRRPQTGIWRDKNRLGEGESRGDTNCWSRAGTLPVKTQPSLARYLSCGPRGRLRHSAGGVPSAAPPHHARRRSCRNIAFTTRPPVETHARAARRHGSPQTLHGATLRCFTTRRDGCDSSAHLWPLVAVVVPNSSPMRPGSRDAIKMHYAGVTLSSSPEQRQPTIRLSSPARHHSLPPPTAHTRPTRAQPTRVPSIVCPSRSSICAGWDLHREGQIEAPILLESQITSQTAARDPTTASAPPAAVVCGVYLPARLMSSRAD
ncbi:hypothetical protein BU16DRAFT_533537 [Lophium mytilinum]|uniref:Uncharacterized protein n=1 Tax=Lophium mytilinum TaxID=390894 RepID=A0A6A6REN9_9PEZI|nr:hypothetical protein BU16DRAFT_533537 [Lophium mytilinum]